MKDSIAQCIEQIEESILQLESNKGQNVREVLERLGLTHLKLPSAQVITLFDMLADGIQPVTKDIVTSFMGITEAYKRLIFSLAGFVEQRAKMLKEKPPAPPKAEVPPPDATAEAADEPGDATAQTTETTKEQKDAETPKAKAREGFFSVRVNTEKLDSLIDLVGKLMVTYAVIAQNKSLDSNAVAGLKELDAVIGQIKTEVDQIRLVPMKQIFVPLHRLITSLTTKMGKKVRIEMTGDDLELDKQIVENLNEPLVHMLRNAVDHGIELPEERVDRGKPEVGSVRLDAFRKGEYAYIRASDDGRGLDPEKIRAKAQERGLLEEGRSYTEQEIFQFILKSGFSTAEKVTDVSGRGVGMDAVVNAVKGQLNGDIRIESALGEGSVFTITIPLDRSANEGIVDALITRVGEEMFIIPIRDVIEVYSPRKHDLVTLLDGTQAVSVRGETYMVVKLGQFFNLKDYDRNAEASQAIVVKTGHLSAAVMVDEVLRQQQVVVTNFTVPVQEIYQVPILGYGMMGEKDALVVDTEDLLDRIQATSSGKASAA